MLLLISPAGIEEARDCVKAAEHLDVVDVKKPDEGSLGANFPWVIREIRDTVPADKPVSATVGDVPYKPGTVAQAALGAVVSRATYIKVGLYGCTTPDGPGYLFVPTILTDVEPGSAVVTGEQFGPVLPVLPYRNLDEAVEAANSTGFGLGGSVWGTDPDRVEAVAERLECGTAWINHHAELSLAQPFAGVKDSGVGVAGGPWGLYGNLRPFVVHRPQEV
ncbi:aldehyde dehydrogenase family protein [Streptomyces sp. p1417]|uniref:Aldehyde dehydrogenase family protein n=1 Tax=Streptomyces typhae TaxID=2681492 RepID=A0A6L6WX98_9ACTN|nr:aldehyde dehydrogenase family protein [Streptomyces typhae]